MNSPERDLCRAMIWSCVRDIALGAGLTRPERSPRDENGKAIYTTKTASARTRTLNAINALESSIAWLNGGEALMPLDLVCAVLDRDPVRLRKALSSAIGLTTVGPAHEIVGPFEAAHVVASAALLRRLELLASEEVLFVPDDDIC